MVKPATWSIALCCEIRRPGRPITNTRVHLLRSDLEPCGVGIPGELHIGGITLARGYLRRPALSAERFMPDPFTREPGGRLYKSGDLARLLADGEIEIALVALLPRPV